MIRDAGVGYLLKSYFPDVQEWQQTDDAELGRKMMQQDPDLVDVVVQKSREDYDRAVAQVGPAAAATQPMVRSGQSFLRSLEPVNQGPAVLTQGVQDIAQLPRELVAYAQGQPRGQQEALRIASEDIYSPAELQARFGSPGATTKTLLRTGGQTLLNIGEGVALQALAGAGLPFFTRIPVGSLVSGLTAAGTATLDPESTPESVRQQALMSGILSGGLQAGGDILSAGGQYIAGLPRFRQAMQQAGEAIRPGEFLESVAQRLNQMRPGMETRQFAVPEWLKSVQARFLPEGRLSPRIGVSETGESLRAKLVQAGKSLEEQRMSFYPQSISFQKVQDVLNPKSTVYENIPTIEKNTIQGLVRDFKKRVFPELGDKTVEEFVKGNPNAQLPTSVVEQWRKIASNQTFEGRTDAIRNTAKQAYQRLFETLKSESSNPAQVARLHKLSSVVEGARQGTLRSGADLFKMALGLIQREPMKIVSGAPQEIGMKIASTFAPETAFKLPGVGVTPVSRETVAKIPVAGQFLSRLPSYKIQPGAQVTGLELQSALGRILGADTGARLVEERRMRQEPIQEELNTALGF